MKFLLIAPRLVGVAVAAASLAASLGAQNIDTRNGLPAPVGGFNFGGTSAASFPFQEIGESFLVPTGYGNLQSFSFFVTSALGGGVEATSSTFSFFAVVRAFDGATPVGPDLFTSALHTRLGTEPRVVATEEVFATGGLSLTPGQMYIASLRASPTTPGGGRYVGAYDPGGYADGVAYSPQGSGFELYIDGADLAFTAQFGPTEVTSTPEPSSMMLLGTGLLLVGSIGRRRRV